MTQADVSRLKRSYDRNIGWCRFWLGIGLAVATLTFTFAVNQVFSSPVERAPIAADELSDMEDSDQVNPISYIGIVVMCSLVLISAVCVVLSAGFKGLYRRNDAALTLLESAHREVQI